MECHLSYGLMWSIQPISVAVYYEGWKSRCLELWKRVVFGCGCHRERQNGLLPPVGFHRVVRCYAGISATPYISANYFKCGRMIKDIEMLEYTIHFWNRYLSVWKKRENFISVVHWVCRTSPLLRSSRRGEQSINLMPSTVSRLKFSLRKRPKASNYYS